MGIKYGRCWGGARISLRGDLYSQESTFPLVTDKKLLWYVKSNLFTLFFDCCILMFIFMYLNGLF